VPADLQSAPFGRSGTDPRGENHIARAWWPPHGETAWLWDHEGPIAPVGETAGSWDGPTRDPQHYRVGMPTFDVVSQVDMQEVRNAVDQANREAGTRFDFKGTDSSIELGESDMVLRSSTEDRLRALHQVLEEKIVRREVSLKALEDGKIEEATKGTVRQRIAIKAGISAEHAKRLNKFIKELNLKGVSSQAQGDQLRVTGKKRDDLQSVIKELKEQDFGIPLQFQNFRD
jgi:cyclic-di-GMP-binding protein